MADLSALKESVQDAYTKYKEAKNAPVTYSGNQEVYEPSDINKNITTRSAFSKYRGLESEYLKKRWYGEQEKEANASTEKTGETKGFVGRGLEALLIPSKFVTGVTKSIVGQGSEENALMEGIKNIETGDTMGTLLRNAGAPEAISLPLGFLLDVATDPLNIATAGTASLLGKTLAGGTKAGLKGALKGAEAGLKTDLGKIVAMTPKLNKTELAGKVIQDALKSTDEFDNLVGETYLDRLAKKPAMASTFENIFGESAGEVAHKGIVKAVDGVFGAGKGDDLINFFQYSPAKWYKASKFIDEMEKVDKTVVTALKDMPMEDRKMAIDEILSSVEAGTYESLGTKIAKTDAAANDVASKIQKEIDDALTVAKDASQDINYIDSMTGNDRLNALVQEANNDKWFKEAINSILDSKKDFYSTGFKAYDKLTEKVKNFTLPVDLKIPEVAKRVGIKSENLNQIKFGEKVMNAYSELISLFKASKISILSPGSVMNAAAGNPIMAHLAGINILDPGYLSSIKDAGSFLSGKLDKSFIRDMFLAGERGAETMEKAYPWIEFMKKYPRTFTATYGFSPEFFNHKYVFADKLDRAFKIGLLKSGDEEKAIKVMNEFFDQMQSGASTVESEVAKKIANKNRQWAPGGYSGAVRKLEGWETGEKSLEYYTNMAANELNSPQFEKLRRTIAEKAESGDRVYKFFNLLINDAVSGYEKIDQTFKLGLAYKLTSKGITEQELLNLRKFVNIAPDDVIGKIKSGSEYKFLLSPERATEAVNFVYMNYNAMPAFVKFMRSLPLAGSPFFSFMYAMADKTGKSIIMNPASFNKVNLLMKELNGAATPLEKETLDSEYNQYMKSEGMVRMPFPFFDRNPLYLNTINWLPYYMNNIFSGTDKTYEDTVPSTLSKIMDSSPFMQDPVGQMMFNYFIQPMILDGEVPQGKFGQQIYPTDATATEKAAYFARDAAEMFVPSAAAGLSPLMPDEAINWLPSYHWRRLSNAIKGRTVIGADAKDPAAERTIKAISSILGVPLYSPNLEYTESNYK